MPKAIRWGTPEHPWSEWFKTPEGQAWWKANGLDKPLPEATLVRIAAIIRTAMMSSRPAVSDSVAIRRTQVANLLKEAERAETRARRARQEAARLEADSR